MSTDKIEIFHDQAMLVGESPLWSGAENSLYWIDIARRIVHCKNIDSRTHRFWELPSEPGCIGLHADGGLIVAMRSGISRLNIETGSLSSLATAPYDRQIMRFNDGRCDAQGRFWAGTMYEPRDRRLGSLYCLDHGNLVERGEPVTVSNGLAFGLDGRSMYQADTTAHCIFRYELDPDSGALGARKQFQMFSSVRDSSDYRGRPDGAALDSEDAYWVAMYEGGTLLRFAPDGSLLQTVHLPVRCPTMPAFGGADLRTLFVTSASQNRSQTELTTHPLSGYVLALRVNVPGRPEPTYRP